MKRRNCPQTSEMYCSTDTQETSAIKSKHYRSNIVSHASKILTYITMRIIESKIYKQLTEDTIFALKVAEG